MMVVAKGLVRERRTPVVAGASSLQSRSMRRMLEFRAAQEENNYTTLVVAERHFSEALPRAGGATLAASAMA